jgi:Heparinase II/III-like protein/Heparinase II/III N-terminus
MSKLGTVLQIGRTFGVRDGILRLNYELRRGSGLMSWRMQSVQGWDSWDLKKIAPNTTAESMRDSRRNGTRQFFFSNVQALRAGLEAIVGADAKQSIIAEANHILEGNLPFFGELSFACGFPPQWFRNPVTGQSVSGRQLWTQMRFASPVYGDLKFILEPSRFLFVYPLVRAYALTGDDRFPEAFWTAVEDWADHSPPMAGPLWICGQECSLRILAWSFALHAFINSPSTKTKRAGLLVSMIAAHAWRTAQTLGYARSQRTNHLISEAVGLWTAGTLYPELREAQLWRSLGAHLLHEAVLDQISPQGVSHQHSFNYQRMILHLLLWTLRLAEIRGSPLHEDIRARTQSAFDFTRTWVDPASGSVPNYGANDGSLIFPLAHGSYADFRPLLQLGAAILGRPVPLPGPWDEAALWFGVKPPLVTEAPLAPAPSAETGYFRLGDENSWALIRAGRYTRRPFHADQLHVDLWWRGMNVARDAGTYLYNGPTPWNNGLARTAVHNTITVDHRDQMRRAGRFLWLDWAQASGRVWSSLQRSRRNHALPNEHCPDYFEGEHDGYKRLGVMHRRMAHRLHGAGWVIVDDVEGTGEHDVSVHWLVADLPYYVSAVISDAPFEVVFKLRDSEMRWSIYASAAGSSSVIRAGKGEVTLSGEGSRRWIESVDTQVFGWESLTYGDLRPAISLIHQTRGQLPFRFVTAILTDERCHLEWKDHQLIILKGEVRNDNSSGECEICRVNLSPKTTAIAGTQTIDTGVPTA